jgi:hypothetical protein
MTEKFEAAKEEAIRMYESGKNHATTDAKKATKVDVS